jgi:hypothetical protein
VTGERPWPPWWSVGLLAGLLAYAALALGYGVAYVVTDKSCGLPGLELLVILATWLGHAGLGLWLAFLVARPDRAMDAFLVGIPVSLVGLAGGFANVGPVVLPAMGCATRDARMLPGLVVTAVVAALLARARRRD